ncbi:MAG: hypothetical protein ABL999_01235 [Pyrinomonadaceae bacterium]
MLDQWEVFTAGPTKPREDRLYLSLNSKGQIFINRHAVEALGSPQAVELLFSKPTTRIGIRRVAPHETSAFPLKERPDGQAKMIHASPFCRNHGIRVTGTVAFNHVELNEDAMLILDLTDTSRVSRVMPAN